MKAAVLAETEEKCAYCESRVTHVYAGDVEHIRPKSRHPELVVAWENLTLVCQQCNTRKADYCSDQEPLVHPYQEDPGAHLVFRGPFCAPVPGSDKGLRTRVRLDLNRQNLLNHRVRRIEQLHTMADRIARMPTSATRDLLVEDLWAEVERGEYVEMSRAFVGSWGL